MSTMCTMSLCDSENILILNKLWIIWNMILVKCDNVKYDLYELKWCEMWGKMWSKWIVKQFKTHAYDCP